MSLDVLAIAAHPDDVEQTCGGTLIRMAEMGYRTGVLDLTAGDMGTRGTPEQRRITERVFDASGRVSEIWSGPPSSSDVTRVDREHGRRELRIEYELSLIHI